MSKKKKFKRIFYGLQEPLIALRFTGRQGALICRAVPLLKFFRHITDPADLHLVELTPRIVVGQIMNFMPLLESYRALVPVKNVDALERFTNAFRNSGIAYCAGLGIDVLKHAGLVEWEQHPGRFHCKETADDVVFRVAVGSSPAVPAFHTLWIDTQEVSRRTYEYLRKRSDGDTKSRSVP